MDICAVLVGKNGFWYWAKLTLDSSFQERNQDRWILAGNVSCSHCLRKSLTPWNNAAILECFTRVLVDAQEEQEGGVVHPTCLGKAWRGPSLGLALVNSARALSEITYFREYDYLAHSITGMRHSSCGSVCNSIQIKINCCRTSGRLLSRQVVQEDYGTTIKNIQVWCKLK